MSSQQEVVRDPVWRLLVNSYIHPFKAFTALHERPLRFHLIAFSLLLLVMAVMASTVSINPDEMAAMQGDQPFSMELFYSALLLFPLMILLPVMYFHWVASSMMGSGKLFDYYKLILWSFIPFMLFIMLAGFVVFILSYLFAPSPLLFIGAQVAQLALLAFYWVVALSVSQKMHWFRSIVVYALGIGVFAGLFWLLER